MDFIGTKFNTQKGGILTVVGKLPKEPGKSHPKYQLECSICSKDTELFPELFTSVKGSLVKGSFPCGCAKSPRWTEEQCRIIITRTVKNKYEFLGFVDEFIGSYTNIKLRCLADGHEWEPNYNAVVNGHRGCPKCSDNVPYTTETAKAKILEVIKDKYEFLGFVGAWNGRRTRVKLYCPKCVHEWEPIFGNVVNGGNGCPCCAGKVPYTPETAKAKILEVIKDRYELRGFVGEFKGNTTNVKLYCPKCVHEWKPMFYCVVNGGQGCPCCAPYGYRPNHPSKLYIIKYTTKSNNTFLKYGITKQDINRRSKQHVKQTGTTGEILHVYEFEDGTVPLQIENEIHDLRDEVGYIETSKEEFPNGYTETLDVRYEKDVLAIIRKYVQDV